MSRLEKVLPNTFARQAWWDSQNSEFQNIKRVFGKVNLVALEGLLWWLILLARASMNDRPGKYIYIYIYTYVFSFIQVYPGMVGQVLMKHVGVMFGCWGLPKSFHWRNPECDQWRSSRPLVKILLFSRSHVHFPPPEFEGSRISRIFQRPCLFHKKKSYLKPRLYWNVPRWSRQEFRCHSYGLLWFYQRPVVQAWDTVTIPKNVRQHRSSASVKKRGFWVHQLSGTTAAESQFATSKGKWVGGLRGIGAW